jgi:exonuclease VII large subunit
MSLAPSKVMSRGFSILKNKDGSVIRSHRQVAPGETIEALMEDGKLILVVQATHDQWQ